MKRVGVILCILSLFIFLSACSEQKSETQPVEIAEMFFGAFEKADYELMKTYSTQECIDTFFHDGDVFGMVWCKVVKMEEPEILSEDECRIFVDVEMETAETSALYGETETSFYIVLNKTNNGSWAVHSFTTG